jgi:ubiquinone/menaquinone biosynthesis C-methylase UbiE
MLAVASWRDSHPDDAQPPAPPGQTRAWRHGFAEWTGLADASVDVYSAAFLFHELPQDASRAVMAEAMRVLRPGGALVLCDNDPQSPVIQALPPALFTLMKSTEPHSDAYYTMPIEEALREAGFRNVESMRTDPRHRTILALR